MSTVSVQPTPVVSTDVVVTNATTKATTDRKRPARLETKSKSLHTVLSKQLMAIKPRPLPPLPGAGAGTKNAAPAAVPAAVPAAATQPTPVTSEKEEKTEKVRVQESDSLLQELRSDGIDNDNDDDDDDNDNDDDDDDDLPPGIRLPHTHSLVFRRSSIDIANHVLSSSEDEDEEDIVLVLDGNHFSEETLLRMSSNMPPAVVVNEEEEEEVVVVEEKNIKEGRDKDVAMSPVVLAVVAPAVVAPAVVAPAVVARSSTFNLESLQRRPTVPGVDSSKRELYLSDSDFESLFGMNKVDWLKLPTWKRITAKKKHKLF